MRNRRNMPPTSLRCSLLLLSVVMGLGYLGYLGYLGSPARARQPATLETPLVFSVEEETVTIYGVIYPARFNQADGNTAHYHLVTWHGGHSTNALIETPVDDLAFHDALVTIGAQPGNNVSLEAWARRFDPASRAPQQKVRGSRLAVSLAWPTGPESVPLHTVIHTPPTRDSPIEWAFGGNRDRWFNRIPFAPRPGCLLCLYSCPSGKVSNAGLSIADYVSSPQRFQVERDILPPDGTPVTVTFRLIS